LIKKIQTEEAIGRKLCHDITEIRPGEFKGAAFRYGHTVCEEDVCNLQRLGKNHVYVLDMEEGEIHENEAAAMLAEALAGDGVTWKDGPTEGKINLFADRDGLLMVNHATLAAFNLVDEVMCATLHTHTLVKKGERVGATRAVPLVMNRAAIDRAAAIASGGDKVLRVLPLLRTKVGLVITGNEVYQGLIEDRFGPVLTEKVRSLGSEVSVISLAPDDESAISGVILSQLNLGCELILLTGGMSVDPDDVTRHGIARAGATEIHYGSAVLPGAMFLVAYLGETPLLGVPACGLYHKITVLDLVLPRILAGEKIGKKELAFLGHGGLCRDCTQCAYPHCPFGKGS
jgi:hypothetical protein